LAHAYNNPVTGIGQNIDEPSEEDMLPKNFKIILTLTLMGMILWACGNSGPGDDTTDNSSTAATMVAQTLEAQMTAISQQATNTPVLPSPTPTATLPIPTATETIIPTNTPQPTATKTPTPTATAVPCNRVGFISDVTVPDGSLFIPGAEFSKVWRLENTGSCAWTANYELVYFSGDKMQGPSVTAFGTRVNPGETIDIGVRLTAPNTPGDYLGYWKLRTPGGTMFGLGANGNQPFWVEIEVINPGTSFVYDFAANICEAQWSDSRAPLPCQGAVGTEANIVRLTDRILMETGVTEDELGLWINLGRYGEVQGIYPAMVVQAGDRFVSEIGCFYDSLECHARFTLSYKEVGTGTVTELGSWVERYDDHTRVLNVDLSGLVGKNVKFILKVTSLTNSSNTEVFWFVPRIQNP
jgi:hypothetical protein